MRGTWDPFDRLVGEVNSRRPHNVAHRRNFNRVRDCAAALLQLAHLSAPLVAAGRTGYPMGGFANLGASHAGLCRLANVRSWE